MNLLTTVLTLIVRFLATILSPVWWAQLFAIIGNRLRRRDSATNTGDDALAAVEAKARRRKFVFVVAMLVIVGSFISLFWTMFPSAPKINRQPFVGLGQVLGEETAKALGDYGQVVIVISDNFNLLGNPISDELQAFCGVLKKHPNMTILATEVVRFDVNQPMGTGELSSKMLNDLVKKYAHAKGLVLFTGLPPLESQPPLQLLSPHPQIIVVQTGLPLTKAYFEQHIVSVAISPWFQNRAVSAVDPKTPREWFDRYFQVITTQNYSTLPN